MTDARLEEYLEQVRHRMTRLSPEEQNATIAEMRSHLQEQVAEARRADPYLSERVATERALQRFGSPEEIGVSFGPHGGEVRSETGELLLRVAKATGRGVGRVAKATGRGIGKTLKWALISVLVLLLVAGSVAVSVLYIFQDDIRQNVPRPIYSHSNSYQVHSGSESGGFELTDEMRSVAIDVSVRPQTGCATIVITDPSGGIVFDNTGNCGQVGTRLTVTKPGHYTISYKFAAYSGHFSVEAHAFNRA